MWAIVSSTMIATATNQRIDAARQNPWSAVGSMTLCVAMLIASEFLPVSLLTPIATDLGATQGMAGQAISISGLFAVITSLFIATMAGRFDRRHVLIVLTGLMLASLVLIAEAQNFAMLMAARALLGVTIGGFWSLATATIMRRSGAFGSQGAGHTLHRQCGGDGLCRADWQLSRRHHWLARSVLGAHADCGAEPGLAMHQPASHAAPNKQSSRQTLWPVETTPCRFRHARRHADLRRRVCHFHGLVSLSRKLHTGDCAATFIVAARIRNRWIRRNLWRERIAGATSLPLDERAADGPGCCHVWPSRGGAHILGSCGRADRVGHSQLRDSGGMVTWLAKGIRDEPESGGGLMIAAIQLSIMLGAAFGGLLLDYISVAATFIGGAVLLVLASLIVGNGKRVADVDGRG